MRELIWPSITEQVGLLNLQATQHPDAFWVISPSLQDKLPSISADLLFPVHNADASTLHELQRRVADLNPSVVIAAGGGKTLDLAKLAARTIQPDSPDRWREKQAMHSLKHPAPPRLIVIPSSAGSGSEASETAVLTVEGVKTPLHAAYLLPDSVMLDPSLLADAPQRVLWNGLWDTLVHALESTLSPIATGQTKYHSLEVFRSAKTMVDIGLQDNGFSAFNASEAQWNSLRAGKAQSVASVGLVHALAHQAESANQWHGEACARLLPNVLRKNAEKAEEKLSAFASATGFDSLEHLLSWAKAAVDRSVGEFVPVPLKGRSTEEIIQNIVKDPCYRTNPVFWTRSEVASWLEAWFYAS